MTSSARPFAPPANPTASGSAYLPGPPALSRVRRGNQAGGRSTQRKREARAQHTLETEGTPLNNFERKDARSHGRLLGEALTDRADRKVGLVNTGSTLTG